MLRLCFLAVLIFGTIGALKLQPRPEAEAATLDRARGLTFAPAVAPRDREWILAGVAKARPEATRLIDEVDGLVTVKTFSDPDGWALGWAEVKGVRRYELRFNVARLNGSRRIDRDAVTLHELGHVIDFAILDDGVRDRLAALVPTTGVCHAGSPTARPPRSASPTRSPSGRCAARSRSPARATACRRPPRWRTGAPRCRRSRSSSTSRRSPSCAC